MINGQILLGTDKKGITSGRCLPVQYGIGFKYEIYKLILLFL